MKITGNKQISRYNRIQQIRRMLDARDENLLDVAAEALYEYERAQYGYDYTRNGDLDRLLRAL